MDIGTSLRVFAEGIQALCMALKDDYYLEVDYVEVVDGDPKFEVTVYRYDGEDNVDLGTYGLEDTELFKEYVQKELGLDDTEVVELT